MNLVQNLLAFSRQNKPEMMEFDLNETVEDTLSIVEAQARLKSVEIVKELAPLEPFYGDNNQLQQALVNLCNNAIDALPQSGRIVIRTRKGAAPSGHGIVLEVEDNGAGIPEEIRDKIFNPFFTTKEVGKGTGLGLALTHDIIERHQGTIEVKSAVGRGTTFTVFLPANNSATPQKNGRGSSNLPSPS
ncbi:MAG: hypothetical protein A3G41_03255 [Elusimicrobia bacterium RIFCSPLOWO2_12_FULL_59_9]|nr:MAG: hypothetical protein A3G41_03255 [Elusimicrobia bacterium RIFCSPLOWO2_12_FULL_59_9]